MENSVVLFLATILFFWNSTSAGMNDFELKFQKLCQQHTAQANPLDLKSKPSFIYSTSISFKWQDRKDWDNDKGIIPEDQ